LRLLIAGIIGLKPFERSALWIEAARIFGNHGTNLFRVRIVDKLSGGRFLGAKIAIYGTIEKLPGRSSQNSHYVVVCAKQALVS
jgi:hypothetical protein